MSLCELALACSASCCISLLTACCHGRMQVLSSDIVFDCGLSLNPLLDVGQVEGAFVIGLGHYLSEAVVYGDGGTLESAGTFEYKVRIVSIAVSKDIVVKTLKARLRVFLYL